MLEREKKERCNDLPPTGRSDLNVNDQHDEQRETRAHTAGISRRLFGHLGRPDGADGPRTVAYGQRLHLNIL